MIQFLCSLTLFASLCTAPQLGALSILKPSQGGTGIGSAVVGDVGKVLTVSDDSPFTYELTAAGAGDITGGASLGTGLNIYDSESSGVLRFNSIAAGTNVTLSTTTNDNTIVISSSGGGGSGTVSTSTNETAGRLSYWTTTSGTPAKLGEVATTTLTASSPLSLSAAVVKVGGSNSVLSIDTSGAWSGTAASLAANGGNCSAGSFPLGVDALGAVESCTDAWTEAENTAAAYISLTGLSASWPLSYNSGSGAFSWVGLATTSNPTAGNIFYSNGTNGLIPIATSSINVGTASALLANGGNCSAGNAPLGVDASGAVESCFDVWTEAENTAAAYLSTVDISANTNLAATWPITLTNDTLSLGFSTSTALAANQLLYGTAVNTFGSNAGLTFNATNGDFRVDNTVSGKRSHIFADAADGTAGMVVSDATDQSEFTLYPFGAEFYGGDYIYYRSPVVEFDDALTGMGTGTPKWTLQISTSTAPQLALSDAASFTSNHWTFRNAGGNLYFATASPTTFATNTLAALTLDSAGKVTFSHGSSTNLSASQSLYIGSHRERDYNEISWSYGSTTQGAGTTTKPVVKVMPAAGTVFEAICHFNNFMRVLAQDEAGNRMNDFVASSTEGTVTLSTNNTFTAGEPLLFYVGTTTNIASNVYGGCTFKYRYN